MAAIRDLTGTASIARLSSQLPQIATVVLAIAIAVELGFLVLAFRDSTGLAARPTPSPASARPVRRGLDAQRIVAAHLFGVAAPANAAGSNVPDTRVNLLLTGTIATNDPKRGLAIIGETAANAKVYSVGASVGGGVTLYAVYTDHVLLDRAGTIESLALPRQALAGGPARAAISGLPGGNATFGQPNLAESVRRLIARDPGVVSEVMRPQQVFSNGQLRGFRVYPGRNRQQFAKLGLQPGDLVTSVNGTALDDPARGNEIFRTIGSSDSVRVTIERNGRPQELTLNMSQVASQAQELEAGGAANSGLIPMNQVPQMPVEDPD